jgi:hypothetical protein
MKTQHILAGSIGVLALSAGALYLSEYLENKKLREGLSKVIKVAATLGAVAASGFMIYALPSNTLRFAVGGFVWGFISSHIDKKDERISTGLYLGAGAVAVFWAGKGLLAYIKYMNDNFTVVYGFSNGRFIPIFVPR